MPTKKQWLETGLHIAAAFVPGVAQIEALARVIPSLSGKVKQDAVVELVKQSLQTTEGISNKDLLNDAEVEKAARAVIDAVVAFQNIVVSRTV